MSKKDSSSKKKRMLAAGTVPWTRTPTGEIEVLLIHRHRRKDMSFPKGKLDKGESMPAAAVRETLEEVGLKVALGSNLGTISYRLKTGQRKTVQYWAAEVSWRVASSFTFTANDEVQSVTWVPLEHVRDTLTYEPDRELFDVFAQQIEAGFPETFSVILLRHAKALSRGPENPIDRYRPLSDEGEDHAELLVHTLAAFGPKKLESSTAVRCMSTLAPLATYLGKDVRTVEGVSQDSWDRGDGAALRGAVARVLKRRKNTIICSHRPVLPDLARELIDLTDSERGTYLREATDLPTGSFSVFHISRAGASSRVVSVEVYPLKTAG